MVEHGGSSAGSYLADPTSPIPSHCASIVVTNTVGVKVACIMCSKVHIRDKASSKDDSWAEVLSKVKCCGESMVFTDVYINTGLPYFLK